MDFSKNKVYITVKDYSVSGEEFQLLIDENLELLKTVPQPLPENLAKYYESEDYISHTDSKRSLFEKLYYLVKQKALRDKVRIIEKYHSKKGTLLDLGAGTGDFLVKAEKCGWNTIGVEPSLKARNIAENKGVKFINDTKSLEDASLDVVTMWHVLEHVPDIQYYILELKRILKPNGLIIIAVPNFKSYDAQHYGKYWAAYDVPRHLWHFSRKTVTTLFANEGMNVIKVLPMLFDSFYVSLLSEKYKTGKLNFIKGFYTGFKSNLKAASSKEYSSIIYVIKPDKN